MRWIAYHVGVDLTLGADMLVVRLLGAYIVTERGSR